MIIKSKKEGYIANYWGWPREYIIQTLD
jgi:hypothetical protein